MVHCRISRRQTEARYSSKFERGLILCQALRLKQVGGHLTDGCTHRENCAAIIRQDFRGHTLMLQHFHGKIFQTSAVIPTVLTNDPIIIKERILESCGNERIASLIANSLLDYFQVRDPQITALRAIMGCLINDDKSWPIIEWTESDNTKSIAIFHFELEEPEEGSWLMHSGQIAVASENAAKYRWKKSRIDWNVAKVGHLKTLFGVAQNMLGLLEWPFGNSIDESYQKKEITAKYISLHPC